MTPIQACEETKELWTEMARIAREENKAVNKDEVPGPWQLYKHRCPCCEYAKYVHCSRCPMQREWIYYSVGGSTPCEDPQSPYNQWNDLTCIEETLCIDIEFFCLLIVEMAEEAIERLRKE